MTSNNKAENEENFIEEESKGCQSTVNGTKSSKSYKEMSLEELNNGV